MVKLLLMDVIGLKTFIPNKNNLVPRVWYCPQASDKYVLSRNYTFYAHTFFKNALLETPQVPPKAPNAIYGLNILRIIFKNSFFLFSIFNSS